jgi:hypothetical protein
MISLSSAWLMPLHLALLVAGAILVRRTVAVRVLAAPLVALVASTAMFYGYVRLGVAYFPIVWIFEGVAVAAFAARIAPRRFLSNQTLVVAMAALALLAAVDTLRSGSTRSVVLTGVRTPDGGIVQDETVEVHR